MASPPSRPDPRLRRTVLRLVAIAAVLVVLAELGVRAISSRLPEPVVFYHPVAQVKVEQMSGLAEAGPTIDVVLAGTSQMAIAGQPIRFTDQRDGHPTTYNAAILAGYPSANRRYLLEEILPRLHPRTVVYGVSSEDVQPGQEAPYDQARATATGLFGDLDRWASAHSALVDHREDLRDPTTLIDALAGSGGSRLSFYRSEVVGPMGSWKAYADHGCETADGSAPPTPPAQPVPFTPDPARVATIWDTVSSMQAQGVTVVVAVMPFADCHFAWTNSAEADAAGRRLIAEGGAARGVQVVDVTGAIHADELFGDPGHVNAQGAHRFTDLLAAALNHDARG